MQYRPVIGLEVHIQAQTQAKMFSFESADYFEDDANSHVDPTSLGLPGALPVPNKAAVEQITKLALATNCEINQNTRFDRKNYFYPDLPKGYQITQKDYPLGLKGFLEVNTEGDARRIRIKQIHLEEDTGKSLHSEQTGKTLLDYNKSGVPLIELVTEPDFQSLAEVTTFAKLLRQTVVYLGVSKAEMQKGQMRFELNISLQKPDQTDLPDYRVEVKNIGSISVLEKVIEYEIQRQSKALDNGEEMLSQTRGLKDMSGVTLLQRTKESEDDYRYFPEPDIPPIHLSDDYLQKLQATLPELPAQRQLRYMQTWELDEQQAEVLVDQAEKGDWLDQFQQYLQENNVEAGEQKQLIKEASKWLTGDISALLDKYELELGDSPVGFADMQTLALMLTENKISGSIVKKVLEIMFKEGGEADKIIEEKGLVQVTDESQIEAWVDQAIADNPKLVESLDKNPNAIKALIGKVMGMSKGKANPQLVDRLLRDKLADQL